MFSKLIGGSPKEGEWEYPDLPTPTGQNSYEDIADQASLIRESWTFETDGWDHHKDLDGATIEVKKIEGSHVKVVRATRVVVGVDFNELVNFFYQPTYEQRNRLYEELTAYDTVKEISDSTHVAHSKFSSPFFGIKGRDFLAIRHKRSLGNGSILITIQSINDHEVPLPFMLLFIMKTVIYFT